MYEIQGESVIADYDMAKLFPEQIEYTRGRWARSPPVRWTAPELMGTNMPPTFQGDVWSVGMLMLEVLTGFVPFYLYRRNEQVMFQVTYYHLRPTRPEGNKQIPDAAWKLMEECWATEPEDRPALRDVHARLIELEKWWEEVQPEPEPEPSFTNSRRFEAYRYD